MSDTRTLDEVVKWLLDLGYIPSFCTACYREHRTGERFMELVKTEQIKNCCQLNAILTLKEYLEDYASQETFKVGTDLLNEAIPQIKQDKIRERLTSQLQAVQNGERDFRF